MEKAVWLSGDTVKKLPNKILSEIELELQKLRKENAELKKVNYILKSATVFFTRPAQVKYQLVKQLRLQSINIKLSCKTLGVSTSCYYAWSNRKMSLRSQQNGEMGAKIHQIHQVSRGTYCEPRITNELRIPGIKCSKKRVARLMKEIGLTVLNKRFFRMQTTDSNHDLPIAPRVFQTDNPATLPNRPNQVWASDITYIATQEGWGYLAIYLDIFTRKIVGYAMADHMRSELVLNALNSALLKQNPNGQEVNQPFRSRVTVCL